MSCAVTLSSTSNCNIEILHLLNLRLKLSHCEQKFKLKRYVDKCSLVLNVYAKDREI